ncbi:methyltransferase domain-containing protein [Microvirga tunisiensis]|uniref:Methyltransferase domain-containing protein n=2 Tax=Pannonibacter tanglangensis TaxID=2750084 RepID=A0ABW9ZJA7_9HYPH|nr:MULTISPECIES: class I SAM-dependent methyltransferase [unclassified Pannonibacter]NBN63149.1 methyltransferase domain-containing protein [Pannonibacter sp. XCT-34]NBN76713.1 methyltransferase domain-containing protein [Pannonibacter sp. XCT-53]
MSGFSKDWLALREPADRAARDPDLVAALAAHLAARSEPRLVDIGCGTGSTWRALKDLLPPTTRWLLVDHDPALLAEAARQVEGDARVRLLQHDLNDLDGLPLDDVDVVTASALFDLVSEPLVVQLADRLAATRTGLYAALNYDGDMRWQPADPLDAVMVELFNAHQRTDKGLGAALGPDATACLERHLGARGFRVLTGPSPWRMAKGQIHLQGELIEGMRQPLTEMAAGRVSGQDIGRWIDRRLADIALSGSSALVGHTDLLALPA